MMAALGGGGTTRAGLLPLHVLTERPRAFSAGAASVAAPGPPRNGTILSRALLRPLPTRSRSSPRSGDCVVGGLELLLPRIAWPPPPRRLAPEVAGRSIRSAGHVKLIQQSYRPRHGLLPDSARGCGGGPVWSTASYPHGLTAWALETAGSSRQQPSAVQAVKRRSRDDCLSRAITRGLDRISGPVAGQRGVQRRSRRFPGERTPATSDYASQLHRRV